MHAHDTVHGADDHASRRPGAAARAVAGPTPVARLAMSPSSVLALQRLAGNAAVQRAVEVGEVTSELEPAGPSTWGAGTAPAAAGGAPGGAPGAGSTLGDPAGATTVAGSTISLAAPMVRADGVVQADTIIANNVVGSNYTPGAGNVW